MLENKLDFVRFFLYTTLMVLGLFIYQAWEREHPPAGTNRSSVAAITQEDTNARFVPTTSQTGEKPAVSSAPVQAATQKHGKLITVTTDDLQLQIDTVGGNIIEAKLLDYKKTLQSSAPVILLTDDPKNRYVAESGLLSDQGPDTKSALPTYQADQDSYQLAPGQDQLLVNLYWQQNGIKVTKTFTFKPHGYDIDISYKVENNTNAAWSGRLFTQLLRTNMPPESALSSMISTFFGAAISSPSDRYQKITFKEMQEKNVEQTIQGGWAAMVQHYFVGAWVPPSDQPFNYYSKVTPNQMYVIGMVGPVLNIPAHSASSVDATLYLGPAIAKYLEAAAPGLKLTIDYGWFWFIADLIFWTMEQIYQLVGNWGLAIILVTVIIKILFYSLSAKSYRSMSALKRLQPRIEMLKEQYGDDKQKLTQSTLELYRQEKVNPMSGCLPILIQIPVFIALYWVLVENVQFRQAPFYFWIHDLSQSDPYYVLPLLMGISMFLQQRLNPPPPDPMQAKLMMFMPVIFTALFLNFPSGLMLYWIVNNTLSFLQQWYIMKRYQQPSAAKPVKQSTAK